MYPDGRKDSWLDTATAGIRFGPDRRAVRQELEGHIEDKVADLRRIFPDIPAGEAWDRALAGMGDPEELKISLAKVHRPWLGWLWRASQVLLVLVLCFGLMTHDPSTWSLWNTRQLRGTDGLVMLEPSGERVKIDGFTITVKSAYLWTHTYPGEETEHRLTVVLRRSSPLFWCKSSGADSWETYISAADSLGVRYPSYQDRWSDPDHGAAWEFIWREGRYDRLFYSDYELTIPLKDPAAEWVRLDYDRLGRSFSFTVELKEAGR